MRVWLDPRKVAERGLSAGDVVRAIREQNIQAAAGVVGASPGLPDVQLQLSINAQGRLRTEPANVTLIVHDPIQPPALDAPTPRDAKALAARVHDIIAAAVETRQSNID